MRMWRTRKKTYVRRECRPFRRPSYRLLRREVLDSVMIMVVLGSESFADCSECRTSDVHIFHPFPVPSPQSSSIISLHPSHNSS